MCVCMYTCTLLSEGFSLAANVFCRLFEYLKGSGTWLRETSFSLSFFERAEVNAAAAAAPTLELYNKRFLSSLEKRMWCTRWTEEINFSRTNVVILWYLKWALKWIDFRSLYWLFVALSIITFFARERSTVGQMTWCKWRRRKCGRVKCALNCLPSLVLWTVC